MRKLHYGCLGLLLALPIITWADAVPVVDASSDGIVLNNAATVSPSTTQTQTASSATTAVVSAAPATVPVQQIVTASNANVPPNKAATLDQVAQQMAYIQQLNLPDQIQQLQQQLQDLRGIIEMQGHKIDQLQNQLTSQYADLNSRLGGHAASGDHAGVSVATIPVSSQVTNTSSTADAVVDNAGVVGATAAPINNEAISKPLATAAASADGKSTSPNAQQMMADAEAKQYQSAVDSIKSKKYSDAIQSLNDYLGKYPNGQYTANAHYWLGEVYVISGSNDKAVKEYTTLVTSYPQSDKTPGAMLKLGNMADDQSKTAQAKGWWQKLVKQYPNDPAAKTAATKLQMLSQVGQ